MPAIQCPQCGTEITTDQDVGELKCECGATIPLAEEPVATEAQWEEFFESSGVDPSTAAELTPPRRKGIRLQPARERYPQLFRYLKLSRILTELAFWITLAFIGYHILFAIDWATVITLSVLIIPVYLIYLATVAGFQLIYVTIDIEANSRATAVYLRAMYDETV